MIDHHKMLSCMLLLVAYTPQVYAEDLSSARGVVPVNEAARPNLEDTIRFDLNLLTSFRGYYLDDYDWPDHVSMTRIPPSSLRIGYAGFHKFVVRHVRGQFRRFTRRAKKEGWMVRPENRDHMPMFQNHIERDFDGSSANGAWWTRNWTDYLPPEKGGAPLTPYTHVYGKDTVWKWGPLSVSNSAKIRIDYLAFLEVNPNPVAEPGAPKTSPVVVDVRPLTRTRSVGTNLQFSVKPHIRVGIPKDGKTETIFRNLSLRGEVEIRQLGQKIINGEITAKWKPGKGVTITVDIALVTW